MIVCSRSVGVTCAQLLHTGLRTVFGLKATMSALCGPETLILLAYRRRNPDEWQVRPQNPNLFLATHMTDYITLAVL